MALIEVVSIIARLFTVRELRGVVSPTDSLKVVLSVEVTSSSFAPFIVSLKAISLPDKCVSASSSIGPLYSCCYLRTSSINSCLAIYCKRG